MRIILYLAITFLISSVPKKSEAELRVVTTTTDLADLVRTIGGTHVLVESIAKANQDPHFVQTKPSLMIKLRRAQLLVSVGLDLESGWLPLLIQGSRNPTIREGTDGYLELGQFVEPIDIPTNTDSIQGHLHLRGNPHYWLDPIRVTRLLPRIVARLILLDPEHRGFFEQQAKAFEATLAYRIQEWAKQMKPFAGTKVLSYHDTFNYFYKRYGLISAGTLENKPGIPPSPRHLSYLIEKARDGRIPVLFHEIYHDKKPSGLVADRSGASLLVLPVSVGGAVGADSYVKLMDYIVQEFLTSMEPE